MDEGFSMILEFGVKYVFEFEETDFESVDKLFVGTVFFLGN